MPLSFRLFSATFSYSCMALGIYFITVSMLGKKVRWIPAVIFCMIYNAFFYSTLPLYFLMPERILEILYDVGINFLMMLCLVLLLRRFMQIPFLHGLAAAFLSNFIVYTVQSVISNVISYYSPTFGGMYLYTFLTIYLPCMLSLAAAALIILVFRKSNFYQYFSHLFRNRTWIILTISASFLLMCVWPILNYMYPDTEPNGIYTIFFFTLIVTGLFAVQFMAMYAAGQDKIKAQEETISQQQAHMALLEELQMEIRAFRHDFTNLLSGLTLQAQEGDLEGIQDFMRRTSGYFDEKLGNEIRQMDSLNNIRQYPLRSLMAMKFAGMRSKKIHATLEVLNPVNEKQKMETEDLLRSLGILLDNAIEAVPEEEGAVRVILLQEEKELYIAVSNNFSQAPNLSALSQKGFTTKGKGHGTGLSSYRKIVSRCAGCVMRTYIKEGFFIQELRIPAV